jgi:hypothetical protein
MVSAEIIRGDERFGSTFKQAAVLTLTEEREVQGLAVGLNDGAVQPSPGTERTGLAAAISDGMTQQVRRRFRLESEPLDQREDNPEDRD